jgi:hypothetical protein
MKKILCLLVVALMVQSGREAQAQITIDGVRDAAYGSAIAVQTVETGFGNNESEWNAVYANVSNNRLNLLITGNLQDNFNKLSIFFDTRAGGENILSSLPNYDFGGSSQNQGGMTFDTGFTADLHMFARAGFGNFEVDIVDRLNGVGPAVLGNRGSSALNGWNSSGTASGTTIGTVNPGSLSDGPSVGNYLSSSIFYGMDNSNNAGIGGNAGYQFAAAADQAAALAVTTGFEFSIDLADLGRDSDIIRLAIMQNNSNHNYLSNQIFGGLPVGTGNLGGDGNGNFINNLSGINFNNFAGNQFITIAVPEPGSLAMLASVGSLGLVFRRRRA